VKLESSFVDDLGADSLDTVELVMPWKRNSSAKFPMRMPRKSPPSSRRLITSTRTTSNSHHHGLFRDRPQRLSPFFCDTVQGLAGFSLFANCPEEFTSV